MPQMTKYTVIPFHPYPKWTAKTQEMYSTNRFSKPSLNNAQEELRVAAQDPIVVDQ